MSDSKLSPQKRYYLKNREQEKAKALAYYYANRDKVLQYQKERYHKNVAAQRVEDHADAPKSFVRSGS